MFRLVRLMNQVVGLSHCYGDVALCLSLCVCDANEEIIFSFLTFFCDNYSLNYHSFKNINDFE